MAQITISDLDPTTLEDTLVFPVDGSATTNKLTISQLRQLTAQTIPWEHKLFDRELTPTEATGLTKAGQRTTPAMTVANQMVKDAYNSGTPVSASNPKFTIGGTVTIDDELWASGFGSTNYLTLNVDPIQHTEPTIIIDDFTFETTSDVTTDQQLIYSTTTGTGSISVQILSGMIRVFMSSHGLAWDLAYQLDITSASANALHRLRLEKTQTGYDWSLAVDNGGYEVVSTITTETLLMPLIDLKIGAGSTNPFLGQLHLTAFANGSPMFYEDQLAYRQATNGWRIATESFKPVIDVLYEQTGHGDFYVLCDDDTVYAPRTTNFLRMTDDVQKLNEYEEDQLKTFKVAFRGSRGSTQADMTAGNGFAAWSNDYLGYFSNNIQNSNPWSIIWNEDDTEVQFGDQTRPRSTKKFLYFVTGDVLSDPAILNAQTVVAQVNTNTTDISKLKTFYSLAGMNYWKSPDISINTSVNTVITHGLNLASPEQAICQIFLKCISASYGYSNNAYVLDWLMADNSTVQYIGGRPLTYLVTTSNITINGCVHGLFIRDKSTAPTTNLVPIATADLPKFAYVIKMWFKEVVT